MNPNEAGGLIMYMKLSAEPGVTLPCGCRTYDVRPYLDGKKLENVVSVAVDVGRPPLYPKRVLVWTIESHVVRSDGTPRVIEGPGGHREIMTAVHMVVLGLDVGVPDSKPELRCKHHPEYER